MKIEIRNRTIVDRSYRAERARALYNVVESQGSEFDLDVEIPQLAQGDPYRIGVVVGPSGSGKSSIGRQLIDDGYYDWSNLVWDRHHAVVADPNWPKGAAFEDVTAALASVGLGSVPAWLRPFYVLSNGEQFRASLARLVLAPGSDVVVDEFTSVIDRRVARIGSAAFAKAWRRSNEGGRAVFLTPHYDVLEWLQPDWVLDLHATVEHAAVADFEEAAEVGTRAKYPGDPVLTVST